MIPQPTDPETVCNDIFKFVSTLEESVTHIMQLVYPDGRYSADISIIGVNNRTLIYDRYCSKPKM